MISFLRTLLQRGSVARSVLSSYTFSLSQHRTGIDFRPYWRSFRLVLVAFFSPSSNLKANKKNKIFESFFGDFGLILASILDLQLSTIALSMAARNSMPGRQGLEAVILESQHEHRFASAFIFPLSHTSYFLILTLDASASNSHTLSTT
jgi:hypothetical protein